MRLQRLTVGLKSRKFHSLQHLMIWPNITWPPLTACRQQQRGNLDFSRDLGQNPIQRGSWCESEYAPDYLGPILISELQARTVEGPRRGILVAGRIMLRISDR